MTRLLLLAAVLAGGVGCRNVAGPREAWNKPKADAPGYTIEEQERRARDKHPLLEDDRRIGPSGFADRPSPTGR